jgi:hypothetical protein
MAAEPSKLTVGEATPDGWFRTHKYELRYITAGERRVPIYVHESMTTYQAVQALVESYTQHITQ